MRDKLRNHQTFSLAQLNWSSVVRLQLTNHLTQEVERNEKSEQLKLFLLLDFSDKLRNHSTFLLNELNWSSVVRLQLTNHLTQEVERNEKKVNNLNFSYYSTLAINSETTRGSYSPNLIGQVWFDYNSLIILHKRLKETKKVNDCNFSYYSTLATNSETTKHSYSPNLIGQVWFDYNSLIILHKRSKETKKSE